MRLFTTIIAGLCISVSAYAQDSTELRSSPYGFSERYLFSSTVEGAEGLRVNPAVLGLGHFANGRTSLFLQGDQMFSKWSSLREFDFSVNLSSLGLGFRRQSDPFLNKALNQFTVGLGGGSKAFSAGFSRDFYYGDLSSSATWNLGLLSRPTRWFSLSYALRNINEPTIGGLQHDRTHIFGLGLRPIDGTEILTLAGDYLKPRTTDWSKGTFRVGAQANLLKGMLLTGAYQRNLGDALPAAGGLPFKDLISVGVNFQYGNSESEFAGLFGDGGLTGALISSNFSAEKKDFFSLFGIASKGIAELSIGGSLDDVRQNGFLGLDAQPSVHDYIRALDKAAEDETIGGVLLNVYPMAGSGITDFSGIVQEVAAAVERVRTAGKRVVAYLPEGGGAAELYVASYAETIISPREAAVGGYGISVSLLRMREFFEKYGIDWDVNAAGDYKTTFQTMFTDSTTPVQRREIEELIQSQYSQLTTRLEKGRNITLTEQQKKMLSGIITTDRAVEMKIIDFTGFKEKAKSELHSMVRGSAEDEYGTVNIFSQKKWNGEWGIRPQIAVVHVEGSITTGESSGGGGLPFLSSGSSTGSETFTRQIKSAMYNDKIKAIVVRVNSGGGSALASDMMYQAIQKAIEKKPVIISFGDVAASGGYYLAVASKKIFSNPATITGSIGVISAKPVVARLLDTLRINEETFKEGEHSDMGSIYRKYTTEERTMVEEYVNSTYQEFLSKVAKGRDISKEQAETLAGGRVYTGEQAQKQKLVDEFGGLYEAVREAKNQAELGNRYDVVFYSAGNSPALQDIFLEATLNGMMSALGLEDFPFLKMESGLMK